MAFETRDISTTRAAGVRTGNIQETGNGKRETGVSMGNKIRTVFAGLSRYLS